MMNGVLSWRYYTLFCILSMAVIAQDATPPEAGEQAPVRGQFRPAPQVDPTRMVALVPVIEAHGARVPLFLEDFHAPASVAGPESPDNPESTGVGRTKLDSSKAQVPAGIIGFRVMYSDDNQWALVDLKAREAAALDHVRNSGDARVRIFTTDELSSAEQARQVSLPPGLSLAQFLQP